MKKNDNEKPFFSIIIPTYNYAQYVKHCLDSLVSQSFHSWEAIVINNYSTDNTVEVVESFLDHRIRLVNFNNHGVIAAARNFGVSKTNADYIAFLDSDDYWMPNKLQKVYDYLRENDSDLICHDIEALYENEKRQYISLGPYTSFDDMLLKGNCLSPTSVVLKRSCFDNVGGFSENKSYFSVEDYDLWLRLARNNVQISYIHEALSVYRIHQSNSSKNKCYAKNYLALIGQYFFEYSGVYPKFAIFKRYALVYRGIFMNHLSTRSLISSFSAVCKMLYFYFLSFIMNPLKAISRK